MTQKEVVTKTVTTTTKHPGHHESKSKKKKVARKKRKRTSPHKAQKVIVREVLVPAKESKVDAILIENFVALQRVLTNLSVKLDNVATQMTKLLDLFEISAKALAEKDFSVDKDNRKVLERLDMVLDQNKTLARGLTLMHERMPSSEMFIPQPSLKVSKRLPPMPVSNLPPMPPMPPQLSESSVPQRKMEQGPAKTFSKEIEDDGEPDLGSIEPPRFESPL